MFRDFMGLSPETTHMFTWLFGDRGIPDGYRHMNGYSSKPFFFFIIHNFLRDPLCSFVEQIYMSRIRIILVLNLWHNYNYHTSKKTWLNTSTFQL